ncbi:hypothetical protein C8R44DRAFT_762323, partial [Mycena epipterygia]
CRQSRFGRREETPWFYCALGMFYCTELRARASRAHKVCRRLYVQQKQRQFGLCTSFKR